MHLYLQTDILNSLTSPTITNNTNAMDSLSDIDFTDLLPLIVIGVIEGSKLEKLQRNTGQKGGEYLQDLLNSTPRYIYNVLYIKKETF